MNNEFGSTNFSIYFNTGKDETTESVNLPAIQFWLETNVAIEREKEIEIASSGLVSLNKDFIDSTEYDTLVNSINKSGLKEQYLNIETERYYRNKWYNPSGDSIVYFDGTYPNSESRQSSFNNSESQKLIVAKNHSKGSLVGFLISKKITDGLQDNNCYSDNILKTKTYEIDSLLADYIKNRDSPNKKNDYVLPFYIGKKCRIYWDISKKGIIEDEHEDKTKHEKVIPEAFVGSKIYLMVNDAIIADSSKEFTEDTHESKSPDGRIQNFLRNKFHHKFYSSYNRKPDFWFLDNAGFFNVVLKTRTQ